MQKEKYYNDIKSVYYADVLTMEGHNLYNTMNI